MKKIIILILIFVSFKCYSQNVVYSYGMNATGQPIINNTIASVNVSTFSASFSTVITGANQVFIFTGVTANDTLPTVASQSFKIVNKGSGNLTLRSRSGGSDIWDAGSLLVTLVLNPGDSYFVTGDGTSWELK